MTCIVDDCEGRGTRHQMCTLHYGRWRRHGDPKVFRPDAKRNCEIAGCPRDHYAKGWCQMHWTRWRKTGDPMGLRPHYSPIAGKPKDRNPAWVGDAALYGAVHRRLSVSRGRATGYDCAHCGKVAGEWAYTHEDPEERMSSEGPFSVHPRFYIPLCVSCHRIFDFAQVQSIGAN
jgi:hypothetical protein